MVATTKVTVNITAIQSLFEPISGKNGVWDNAVKFSTATRERMNKNVPKRTLHLLAGNRNNTAIAYLQCYCTFWNVVDYSKFVREGTHFIRPASGQFLRLPVEGGSRSTGPFIFRHWVHGQKENDFIAKSVAESLAFQSYA